MQNYNLKRAFFLSLFLLVVWGIYRFLFILPEAVEEIIIKPLIWLLPVIYLLKKEKEKVSSIGYTTKNLFPAIYLSVGIGIIFAAESMLINYLKYQGFNFASNIGSIFFFGALALSFVTAGVEETVFRGYLFTRFNKGLKNELLANLLSSGIWLLIHLPVVFFVWKLSLIPAATYLILTFVYGIGSAFVFARTGNIVSSIILHVLWEWPIILFR